MSDSDPNPKGGPRTPAGKAASALNATRHGLTAITPVIPGIESAEAWESHRSGVIESLQPVGHLETVFAERIALILWRMHRVVRYESESLALAQTPEPDLPPASSLPWEPLAHIPGWASGSPDSCKPPSRAVVCHLLRGLMDLGDTELIKTPAATAVVHALAAQAGVEDERSLPFFTPERMGTAYCQAATLRRTVDLLAERARTSSEDLLQSAVGKLAADLAASREDPPAPDPESLFPGTIVFERVVRYEAHLNRQLRSAMTDLEVLQARRRGAATPLARIDVTGLPEQ